MRWGLRASLQGTQPEITNIVPPLGHSPQDLPSPQPAGTLSNFQLQSQHSERAGASLPAMNCIFKNQSADREALGWVARGEMFICPWQNSTTAPANT